MATNKLLQSLSEDPQLEKQIGCMAGILQLFDRHQVLTGRRLYGHKRISATPGSRSASSGGSMDNCGSPNMDQSLITDDVFRSDTKQIRPNSPASRRNSSTSPDQLKLEPVTPEKLANLRGASVSPIQETYTPLSSRDQLPKLPFDKPVSIAPHRLDSSRSLHEPRLNIVPLEAKVFPRRSVDTAERAAAAAARGALRELSRIPDHAMDELSNAPSSIREVVRASFGHQEHPKPAVSSYRISEAPPSRALLPTREVPTCKHGLPLVDISFRPGSNLRTCTECSRLGVNYGNGVPLAAVKRETSRPLVHYKSNRPIEGLSRTSADLSESLRLLAKLREGPRFTSSNDNNHTNFGNKVQATSYAQPGRSSFDLSKETGSFTRFSFPRPSSDQRLNSYEPGRASSVDSLLQQCGTNPREIPRLSLDGRGSGYKTETKLQNRTLMTSRSVSCSNSDCDNDSIQEKRNSISSNVVAKLMGLEELPSGHESSAKLQSKLHEISSFSSNGMSSYMTRPTTLSTDSNLQFNQYGKHLSPSIFPSKRRDDIRIPLDYEDDEYDDYHAYGQDSARTGAGQLKFRSGDRLLMRDGSPYNLGHSCYQPKNHHLMEDRPPHVLSSAAKICAQIEEMQRADSWHKEAEKAARMSPTPSQGSKQDLEALRQLLGAIHLRKDNPHRYNSFFDKLDAHPSETAPYMQHQHQSEISGRMFNHREHMEPAQQPFAISTEWKTKRVLNEDEGSQTQSVSSTTSSSRKVSQETYNRRPPLPSSSRTPEQSPRSRDARSPISSTASTPRRSPVVRNSGSTATGNRSKSHGIQSGYVSPRAPSPRHSSNQQQRQSSDKSSTSSSREQQNNKTTSNSRTRAKLIVKENEKRVDKKKPLKDREEYKASLVSLKPQVPDRRQSSGGHPVSARNSSARAGRKMQSADAKSTRSSNASIGKPGEVKRRLNFTHGHISTETPVEEPHFVDKTVVDEVHDEANSICEIDQSTEVASSVTAINETVESSTVCQTEPESPHLETEDSFMDVEEQFMDVAEHFDECVEGASSFSNDEDCTSASEVMSGMFHGVSTPNVHQAGALKLLGKENEDADSQEGDKSTGSCEQPSPISVLDGPFYHEEDVPSPATTSKFALKFEVMNDGSKDTNSLERCCSPEVSDVCTFIPSITCNENADFEYVKEVLEMAGVAPPSTPDSSFICKLAPLESQLFFTLESKAQALEKQSSSEDYVDHHLKMQSEQKAASCMWRRRLLFDAVNEILKSKMSQWLYLQQQPWRLAVNMHDTALYPKTLQPFISGFDAQNNVCLRREGGAVLLKEVWDEIVKRGYGGRKRKRSKSNCSMDMDVKKIPNAEQDNDCNDNEDERVSFDGDMVSDMVAEQSKAGGIMEEWGGYGLKLDIEKGEIAMDVERLIFKDLIDQTLIDLGYPLAHFTHSASMKRLQLSKVN